jgi:hypothetical protein
VSVSRPTFALAAALVLCAAPASAQWPLPMPQPQQPAYGQPSYLPPGMPPVILPSPPMQGAQELEQKLEESKRADAGRKLEWVWIDLHGGFEQVGVTTFKGDSAITSGGPTSSSGGVIGGAIGARLLFLTLLLRARAGFGAIGHLFRIGPEIGLHVPLGRVEPHVELGAGFAAFTHLAGGGSRPLGGFGRVGFGVDFFLAPVFSLGIGLTTEILGLRTANASAVGGTIAATSTAGLHF